MTADDFALFPSLNTVALTGKREGGRERMSIGKLEDDVEREDDVGEEEEGEGSDEEGRRRRDWKWLHPE